jgi:hypothetical protein
MAKLKFTMNPPYHRESKKIIFQFDDDLNIHEFKTICIRLASAIGYAASSIKSSFGEEYDGDVDYELRDIYNKLRNDE